MARQKWGGATNKFKKSETKYIFKLVRYAALICLRRVKQFTFLFFDQTVKTSPPHFLDFLYFWYFLGWGGLSWPESDSARKIIIKHGGKMHHVPSTMYPASCTMYPAPCTMHHVPCTMYQKQRVGANAPCTQHHAPCTMDFSESRFGISAKNQYGQHNKNKSGKKCSASGGPLWACKNGAGH